MHKGSFVAAFELATGKEVWRTERDELPSWSTPNVYEGKGRAELVTSSPNYSRGYDPLTGKELWKLGGHSKITTPTPIFAHDLIFLTDGYSRPGIKPIYALRPGASGDITLQVGQNKNAHVVWSKRREGPYTPTPLVYGDFLYTVTNRGMLTCWDARSGMQVYTEQLPTHEGYSASPVAADGRLYITGEDGEILVIKTGQQYELLATNDMGEPCLATPAITRGLLIVRSQRYVWGLRSADRTGN
jgi:outer membrane protein assembly factor BamB